MRVPSAIRQHIIQNKKSKALLGTFAAWEKYLAAAQGHYKKYRPYSGETKSPNLAILNTTQ
jgi:hypothetical protein